ncbi:MAG: hypothetical protein JWP95_1958 [Actinotalea sp.]|nr:hypothetical protein [Actinotalea sp.]
MLTRISRLAAAASAIALTVAVASSASAAPIDAGDNAHYIQTGNTVWCLYDDPFTIAEAAIYAPGATVDAVDPCYPADDGVNDDAFDDIWGVWVYDAVTDTGADYGLTELDPFIVDQTTDASGDVIVQGPVLNLVGLDVSVQHRYYVAGDLARILVSYTNPTAAAITVDTGTYSNFGSDSSTELLSETSGDSAVTAADRWFVTGDAADGWDPVITTATSGPGAVQPPTLLEQDFDDVYTEQSITVAPGETVHLAFFTRVTGYTPELDATTNYDAAAAAAVVAGAEFNTFTGRLTAGIAPSTVVLNWGTVPAVVVPPVVTPPVVTPPAPAAPARPVVARPTFTG